MLWVLVFRSWAVLPSLLQGHLMALKPALCSYHINRRALQSSQLQLVFASTLTKDAAQNFASSPALLYTKVGYSYLKAANMNTLENTAQPNPRYYPTSPGGLYRCRYFAQHCYWSLPGRIQRVPQGLQCTCHKLAKRKWNTRAVGSCGSEVMAMQQMGALTTLRCSTLLGRDAASQSWLHSCWASLKSILLQQQACVGQQLKSPF